jgi:hypothetical protein
LWCPVAPVGIQRAGQWTPFLIVHWDQAILPPPEIMGVMVIPALGFTGKGFVVGLLP